MPGILSEVGEHGIQVVLLSSHKMEELSAKPQQLLIRHTHTPLGALHPIVSA